MRARCPDCVHLTASTYIYPPTLAQDKAHQLWSCPPICYKSSPNIVGSTSWEASWTFQCNAGLGPALADHCEIPVELDPQEALLGNKPV